MNEQKKKLEFKTNSTFLKLAVFASFVYYSCLLRLLQLTRAHQSNTNLSALMAQIHTRVDAGEKDTKLQ